MTLGFGVGCLHWEVVDRTWSESRQADLLREMTPGYSDDLSEMLSAIPSLRDLSVQTSGWRYGPPLKEPVRTRPLGHTIHGGGGLWPHPSRGRVEFSLDVPRRVQQVLTPWVPQNMPETFKVLTDYDGRFPVTIVVTEGDYLGYSPSSGIAVVREFLASEMHQRFGSDAPLRLTMVAPSPMWLNGWFVAGREIPVGDVRTEWEIRSGYDQLTIRYSGDPAEEVSMFLHWFQTVASEFGLYYFLESEGAVERGLWKDVNTKLQKAVRLMDGTGVRAALRRTLSGGRHIRSASLSVLTAKSDSVQRLGASQRAVEKLYRELDHVPILEKRISLALDELATYEVPGLVDIAALLEARRSDNLQAASLAIGTIVGLAAGAGLSAALGA